MSKRIAIVMLLGLCQVFPAIASMVEVGQLLSLSLEDLMATKVMISTNTRQTLSRAPSVVSVITAEDIKATGATNLAEILQSVPGIYVKPNLFGFRSGLSFRGAASQHTLLMVNGDPVKDLVWNTGIFSKPMSTTLIERIEIIRGPGSALYGSDASAGVINVITKTAAGVKQSEAGMRAGSFDTHAGWLQYGGSWDGFDIGLTAELFHSNGHAPSIAVDGQTARDPSISYAPANAHYGWDGETVSFSAAKGNWRVLADFMRKNNIEIGLTGAAVLDPRTQGSDSQSSLALLYGNEAFARDWGLNAELRYRDLDYTSGDGFFERPPGFNCTNSVKYCNGGALGLYPDGLINQMRSGERHINFELSGLYSGVKNHAIRVGGGHVMQDLYSVQHFVNYGVGADGNPLPAGGPLVDISGSPYAFAPKMDRKNGYLFLQDVWNIAPGWELTLGARYDHYSDFGNALNPRLAFVWETTDRLTTKLMYGQAFRAPSYLELYAKTAASTPNPLLTPEKSNTWDLSFSYLASRDLHLDIDFYQFKQTNLIGLDGTSTYQNMGNNISRGVEFEAIWQATKAVRVRGNLSARDDTTPYNSIPRQTAYLRADWAFRPQWNWNLQANWIDKHLLSPGNPRQPIDAYTWVDTTLRYSHDKNWEYAASIRNLLDVDAREYSSGSIPNNLPLPRRNLFMELRYKF